ncbi:hypothetical protein RHS03_05018, partial [Rhizoctonia solani]
MRNSASLAVLITLMAVGGTIAAPIEDHPGSGHAPIPDGHQVNHTVIPVSGPKISNRDMNPAINTYGSKLASVGEVKAVTGELNAKVEDASGVIQDNIHVPDTSAHVDIDLSKGSDKSGPQQQPQPQSEPHSEPQPQPESQPQPEQQSEPEHEPKPQSESSPESGNPGKLPEQPQGNAGDCLDINEVREGFQANACATIDLKAGKECLDGMHKVTNKTGDDVKAKANMVLGGTHQVHDRPTNTVHDVEKGAQVAGKVDIDVDTDAMKAPGAPHRPALAVAESIEGTNPN